MRLPPIFQPGDPRCPQTSISSAWVHWWLTGPLRKREEEWVANPLGSGLLSQELLGSPWDLKELRPPQTLWWTPTLVQSLRGVQKTARWERQQRKCLLWCGAGLTSTVLSFPLTKTHVKDGCKGKGRKSHNSLGSLRWTTTSNPTTLQAVPAHQCYMRSSGCWARSPPHAGCTARPALLWKHWRASRRSFCEERTTRFQSSLKKMDSQGTQWLKTK